MAATRTKKRYLLCVQNKGCEDLEPRSCTNSFLTLVRPKRATCGSSTSLARTIVSADYFVALDLPREAERALAGATR